MTVKSLTASMQATPARQASVARTAAVKIAAATTARASFIAETDTLAKRIARAFKNTQQSFSIAQLQKASATMASLRNKTASQQEAALKHLATAIRTGHDTSSIIAQIEDLATLRGQLATLKMVADATMDDAQNGTDDLLQIDDSGFIQPEDDNVIDQLPDTTQPTAADTPMDPMPPMDTAAPAAPMDPMAPNPMAAARRKADMTFTENESDAAPVGTPEDAILQTQPSDPQEANLPPAPTTSSRRTRAQLPVPGDDDSGFTVPESDATPVGTPEPHTDTLDPDASYAKDAPAGEPSSSLPVISTRRQADAPVSDTELDTMAPAGDAAPVEVTVTNSASDTDPDALTDPTDDDMFADDPMSTDDAADDDVVTDDDHTAPADDDSDQFGLGADTSLDDIFASEILDDGIDDTPTDPEDTPMTAAAARRQTASRSAGSTAAENDVVRAIFSDL
jgi:hypothetical protein